MTNRVHKACRLLATLAIAALLTVALTGCKSGEKKAAMHYTDGSCCAKAVAASKTCEHPCCVEAAAKGEVCKKCNPT